MFIIAMIWHTQFYFAPDGGGGGGGGGGGSDGELDPKVAASFQRALDRKNGDALQLATQLFDDNYQSRQANAQLRQENENLKKQLPGQGSVVLTAEEATIWNKYKAAGTVEEIEQGLRERDQFKSAVETATYKETLRQVAETAAFKPSVLEVLDTAAKATGKTLQYNKKEVEIDGKKTFRAYVKDGDAETELTAYAEQNWAEHLPSLRASTDSTQTTTTTQGVRFPNQHSGGGSQTQTKNLTDSFIAAQNEKGAKAKNPLLNSS